MSTRCIVKLFIDDQPEIQYYHHTDGYESFMIPDLSTILQNSKKDDRYDKTLLHDAFNKQGEYEEESWGTLHGDLEWMYFIHIDKFMKTVYIDYCKINMLNKDYRDVFEYPEKHADKLKCADATGKPVERLQLDIPDEYYDLLREEADEKEISVDQLLNDILRAAIKSGEFEKIIKQMKQ